MREYGKEDIYKPKRTSNTIIYSNLPQSLAISGNLPVSVILPSTTTACTVTARKEGRKEGKVRIWMFKLHSCRILVLCVF
jgi:hypothetical protein